MLVARARLNLVIRHSSFVIRHSSFVIVSRLERNNGCPVKSAILFRTALLLTCSNAFMTFAWYAHLRNWNDKKWYIAALLSWGIALFEYLLQVPANRLGYETLSLAQLKILQEIIALSVFAPFAVIYMHQPLKLDYLWSGLCLAGAAYFMFRS